MKTPTRPPKAIPKIILTGKSLIVKHQSRTHDSLRHKAAQRKAQDIEEAVQWCRDNNKRGWSAIKSGLFPLVKKYTTIDNRLDGKVTHGAEREYCSILTSKEEESLVRYLKNKSRCLQGLNQKETSVLVLNILKTRQAVNKKGGRRFVPLSTNAKNALMREKVSRSFFSKLLTKHPGLLMKTPKKVDINRGFNVTRSMGIEYLDDLAEEINTLGIGELEKVDGGVCLVILTHLELSFMMKHRSLSIMVTRSTPPRKCLVS